MNRPLALLVAGAYFMETLDGTIIATAAPAVAADLDVAAVDVNVAMTAYLITVAVGIPVSGWLADRFGARRIFLLAITVFTLASAMCALSGSLPELTGWRVVQGLGGAMMVPVGRLMVLRATAKHDLLAAVAYLTWPALVAPVVAPFLGGWLSTHASWQWIFAINIPLGLLALVGAYRLVPLLPVERVPPLDWVGFVLCAVTLASLLLGLEQVGGGHAAGAAQPAGGWRGWAALLAVAAVAGVLTVVRMRRARHPLLDLQAFRVPTFRVGSTGGLVYRMAISAAPFLLPLMFQLAFGWTAVHAGLMVMAVFVGNLVVKPATTPLIRRFGFRTVIISSALGGGLLFLACAFLQPSTPTPVIVGVLVLSGAFRSTGFSGYNSLQFADIEPGRLSGANTLSATLTQLAAGLGIAVGALLLRVADGVVPSDTAGTGVLEHYAVAFVGLALLMVYPAVDAARGLHPGAGAHVSGHLAPRRTASRGREPS